MRKINTRDFHVATRSTSRDINRRIALNVIHEHQPISRAELARRMKVTRGVAGVLVQELLDQDLIYEGATGEAAFGRKPTLLHIKSHDRLVVAVDIRFSKTYIMVCDFSGRQVALETCDTKFSIPELIRDLGERIRRLIKTTGTSAGVEGVGVAVPGMVDHRTGRVLNAPQLGWRDVDIRDKYQRLLAYVVLHPGADADTQRLRTHVRDELANYKVPREIVVLDELPRNASGKVVKKDLPDA
jgi:acyl-CoA synthetase (AMP-forming)/AMP-acid ligase II